MRVTDQVDDGVGITRPVGIGLEELPGAPRVLVVDARQTGRVDERDVGQRRGGPGDVDGVDVGLGERSEPDVQCSLGTAESQRFDPSVAQAGNDLVPRTALVPAHDARALTRIGRCKTLADEGIEQRGLSGLHPTGDRHTERSAQAFHHLARCSCRLGVVSPIGERTSDLEDLLGDTWLRRDRHDPTPANDAESRPRAAQRCQVGVEALRSLLALWWPRFAASA